MHPSLVQQLRFYPNFFGVEQQHHYEYYYYLHDDMLLFQVVKIVVMLVVVASAVGVVVVFVFVNDPVVVEMVVPFDDDYDSMGIDGIVNEIERIHSFFLSCTTAPVLTLCVLCTSQ